MAHSIPQHSCKISTHKTAPWCLFSPACPFCTAMLWRDNARRTQRPMPTAPAVFCFYVFSSLLLMSNDTSSTCTSKCPMPHNHHSRFPAASMIMLSASSALQDFSTQLIRHRCCWDIAAAVQKILQDAFSGVHSQASVPCCQAGSVYRLRGIMAGNRW